jgi:dephospho-CoA kinase
VLVVDCTLATQIHRVMLRNGWDEDTVRRVIAQQSSRERRRSLADAVIFNDSTSRELLNAQVRSLWKHWVAG